MCNCMELDVPHLGIVLTPGCKIKLGRFKLDIWVVSFGWFAFGGNRPFCGWYLTSLSDPTKIRPLQLPDLDDIYIIET